LSFKTKTRVAPPIGNKSNQKTKVTITIALMVSKLVSPLFTLTFCGFLLIGPVGQDRISPRRGNHNHVSIF
jgi:hypothetical protein